MRTLQSAVLFVVLPLCLAPAYEWPNAAETLQLVAAASRKTSALTVRERELTADATARVTAASEADNLLGRPYDAKQVDGLKRQLASLEGEQTRTRELLAIAKIRSPEERAEKVKEADAEVEAARQRLQDATAPFREEEQKTREEQTPLAEALKAFGERFVRSPEGLGIETMTVSGDPVSGMAVIAWQGAGRAQLFHGQLQLGDPPRRQDEEKQLLADRYPVILLNLGAIRLMAGNVQVMVSTPRPEWRDGKQIQDLVAKLVDLEGLAALPTAPDGDAYRATVVQAVEAVKRTADRTARLREATGKKRQAVADATARQNELSRPYDPELVAGLERQLASQERDLAGRRAMLELALIEDPAQRAAKREQTKAEIDQARKDWNDAKVPLRGERVAVDAERRVAEFAFWRLLAGVLEAPTEFGLVEADITNASVAAKRVSVSWRDVRQVQLASAELAFARSPDSAQKKDTELAGKYPVLSVDAGSISFLLGNVAVRLRTSKTEWQGTDQLLELVPKLMDLDTIAGWPAMEDPTPRP